MNKEVFDIIKEASDNGVYLNENQVERIIRLLIDDFELDKYVKKIDFHDPDKNPSYDFFTNTLAFDFSWGGTSYNKNNKYNRNLLYLFAIVHELIHASQTKFLDSYEYDSINNVITKYKYRLIKEFYEYNKHRYGFYYNYVPTLEDLEYKKYTVHKDDEDYVKKLNSNYHRYHDLFPCEREADIEGYKYVIDLLEEFDPSSKEIQYFKNRLNRCYLYKYKFEDNNLIYTPILCYLAIFGHVDFKQEINYFRYLMDEYYKLPLETRLEYGLRINRVEYDCFYNSINEEKDKTL